ncbi:HupE/UreJ family protein [Mesorhizobium sp. M8A.F.Ca.ET.208.01.1.1]|uniref:HupE/UreJ family protein n=1 Tax=unclassified Mesorhizobium TaxID=325217 RepID=UPI000FC9E384|nr:MULTISPECIES: HupE/UreJ family protein [unclassified Mesorhizobium]RUW51506.1 HupE/UreJ family protein [Mesorhizobium sp. M8A.F.Ca.ET.021.01.1.1]TGQ92417.1 HupE/UreJ family protein [Mesorhizobium sp. M8A.F.Ca.ET.208.01.1.1]TGT52321.1 HupE/UreJ family protein [Mesorhizobium sp. M8A.F.Ca.ET.167.01.1.1]
MIRFAALLTVLLQLFQSAPAAAHEMRPAYLEMRETEPDVFVAVWKVPALGDRRLSLYARLPETCRAENEPTRSIDGGAYIERWTAACDGGLKGREITIDGLRSTLTDALIHITYRDGTTEIARLKPDMPSTVIKGAQASFEVAETYFRLGVDHILSGIDHLLFVLALMLLIHNRWTLVKTITAFTIAHSITLAGAALGYFSLPQKPVEATIALSIAFVASELTKIKPAERRLSETYPWMVAFAFGLLHGFGFAGALKEIGLPQVDVPLALLTFNLGVEAGQMLFVAAVLIAFRIVTTLITIPIVAARSTAAYLIGTMAAGWLITRLAGFVV